MRGGSSGDRITDRLDGTQGGSNPATEGAEKCNYVMSIMFTGLTVLQLTAHSTQYSVDR